MTKRGKRIVDDPDQLSMLDLLLQRREERETAAPGRCCIKSRLDAAIRQSLKDAPRSREAVADLMSESSGHEVTVHMVNSWAADSHPHRLPDFLIPHFIEATGSDAVFQILADSLKRHVLPDVEALRAEMQHRTEEIKRLQKEQHRATAFLRELEGEP